MTQIWFKESADNSGTYLIKMIQTCKSKYIQKNITVLKFEQWAFFQGIFTRSETEHSIFFAIVINYIYISAALDQCKTFYLWQYTSKKNCDNLLIFVFKFK